MPFSFSLDTQRIVLPWSSPVPGSVRPQVVGLPRTEAVLLHAVCTRRGLTASRVINHALVLGAYHEDPHIHRKQRREDDPAAESYRKLSFRYSLPGLVAMQRLRERTALGRYNRAPAWRLARNCVRFYAEKAGTFEIDFDSAARQAIFEHIQDRLVVPPPLDSLVYRIDAVRAARRRSIDEQLLSLDAEMGKPMIGYPEELTGEMSPAWLAAIAAEEAAFDAEMREGEG